MNPVNEFKVVERIQSVISIGEIAEQTRFTRRRARKLSPTVFLTSCLSVSAISSASLLTAAFIAGVISKTKVSKTAIFKRMKTAGVAFLKAILTATLTAMVREGENSSTLNKNMMRFGRVLVQDSTNISLPSRLSDAYPGSRNQKKRSASMKIQAVFDLKNDRYVSFELTPYTENDQSKTLDILDEVSPGDLILRDLGYFSIASLMGIEQRGGYFVSRHFHRTRLFTSGGKSINLLRLLKKKEALDTTVLMGSDDRFPVRLVATPVPDDVAAERRFKAKNTRDRRALPSKEQLALLGWEIMITNISKEDLKAADVYHLYELRWRIENVFKVWKSYFKMSEVPSRMSVQQLECLVYSRLIAITVFHENTWTSLRIRLDDKDQAPAISLIKVAQIVTQCQALITLAIHLGEEDIVLENLEKHGRYDKRKRRNFQGILDEMLLG